MVQTFQILVFFCRFVGKQLRFQVVVANHTNWEVKISKKNDGFGTLSNNCTLLWRQANYEIEMLKTKASRPLLELSMQKIHATVAPDSSCWDSSWKCRSQKFFWISRALQSPAAFKTNIVSGNVLLYSIRTLNPPLFDPSLTPWFLVSVLKKHVVLCYNLFHQNFTSFCTMFLFFMLGRWKIFAICRQ